jgi:hypothetical protein
MLPPAGWAESPFDSSKARSFCPGTNEKLTVRQELTEKRRGVRLAGKVSESESTETKKPPVGGFTTLLIALIILYFPMVPGAGLEPAQRERRGILNPLCLPIPPSGLGI